MGAGNRETRILKLLINEEFFHSPEKPEKFFLRGWFREGDTIPIPISEESPEFSLPLIFRPFQEIKKHEKKQLQVAGIGPLDCEHKSGVFLLKGRSWKSREQPAEVWSNTKAPFGVVKLVYSVTLGSGKTTKYDSSRQSTIRLVEIGTGAKSLLVPPPPVAFETGGYDSPEALCNAFLVALATRQWKEGFQCFTPNAQNIVVLHLTEMARFVARNDATKETLDQILSKHGYDQVQARFRKAKESERQLRMSVRDPKQLSVQDRKRIKAELQRLREKAFLDSADMIAETEIFVEEILNWFQENFSGGGPRRTAGIANLQVTENKGTAKVEVAGREESELILRKSGGGWLIDFEVYYSSNVFLWSLLDTIHGWRL